MGAGPGSTIHGSRAQLTLPLLLEEGKARRGEVAQLRMGQVLGSGGMAIVRSAIQLPLNRRVAVKIPHRTEDGIASRSVLDEAFVAGTLEHPNIVPIHAVGRDREGYPLLVMKQIEGAPWRRELRKDDRRQRLAEHIGTLMQVCNAVEFAHSRSVIHRDLKPENVMIGSFGEVYVVDWGLAVTLSAEHRGRLRLASHVQDAEGTPGYMAPEMLSADGSRIGEHTDVYLLGGLLHFVLTGTSPFHRQTMNDRLAHPEQTPTMDEAVDVPLGLKRICLQALALEPSSRFESVAALRTALGLALQHLSSVEISTSAWERLIDLEALGSGAEEDARQIEEKLIEARFGFQQALDAWPGNVDAQRGEQRAVEWACAYEIERDNLMGARTLFDALRAPNPDLQERLDALDRDVRLRRDQVRALEEFGRQEDVSVDASRRRRAVAAIGGAALGGIATLVVIQRLAGAEVGYPAALGLVAATTLAAAGSERLWFRTTNVANRRLHRAMEVSLAGAAAILVFSWWGGLSLGDASALTMACMGTALLTTNVSFSLKFRKSVVVAYATAALLTLLSESRPWVLVIGASMTIAAALLELAASESPAEASNSTDEGEVAIEPGTVPKPAAASRAADAPQAVPPDLDEATELWSRSAASPRAEAPAVGMADRFDLGGLPRVATVDHGVADAEVFLQLGAVISAGGMGTVRSATQLPLQRRVAVKTATDAPGALAALLREAFVAGVLDHPNVVPVHALGRDESDRPLLVMKYIEGSAWSESLRAPTRLARIDHHLETLMQVCNAVDYAHHRGIVHRDLKATNIMVGAFGEVQVLDWGLAVAIGPERADALLPASHVRAIEGTPAYMAPEMAVADAAAIGPATDVYLLGGLLHFILRGGPPHEGATIADRAAGRRATPHPIRDAEVSPELIAICDRALHPDPSKRFSSPATMKEAIAHFLAHKGSLSLTSTAERRIDALEVLLARPTAGNVERQVQQLITEARFAFHAALRVSPDSVRAQRGLQRILEIAFAREIEGDNYDGAASLLAAMKEDRPELSSRLSALEVSLAARQARVRALEELERGVDLAVDKRTRMWTAVAHGGVVVTAVLGLAVTRSLGVHEAGYLDAIVIVFVMVIVNGYQKLRGRVDTNEVNVRLRRVMVTAMAGGLVHLVASWYLGVDFTTGVALLLVNFALTAAVAASTISWLTLPGTLAFVPGAVGLMLWPSYRPWILMVAFATAFGALAVASRSVRENARAPTGPGHRRGSTPSG